MNKKLDVGVIGLAVMGRSLALNLCDHGYQVGGFNRNQQITDEMTSKWPHKNFSPFYSLGEMVLALERPRRVILMVKAGAAVDALMEQLFPILEDGDLILDCGNSYYIDTQRRYQTALEQGIHFFGIGVSGGEEGARFGPAIMPGGNQKVYEKELRTMLESISAKAPDGKPCCCFIGPGGAGHFVKMVHNGIEYADMQLIAEVYLLLKHTCGLNNTVLSELFSKWNEGELQSYLIGITADILKEKDEDGSRELVDLIVDSTGQKGTGRWTVIEALNLGVDVSMIASACNARILSNETDLRCQSAKASVSSPMPLADSDYFYEVVRHGLYAAKILAYAQGFSLMQKASVEYGWNLNLSDCAGVFRAGCIIRAAFLNEIMAAYQENPNLTNLTCAPFFQEKLHENQSSLRTFAITAIQNHLYTPAFQNAVAFLEVLYGAHMGANLLQAQRDYFGAHTFSRTDREGTFHHEWGQQYE